jgi:TRAP-type C4-dicarboxylate transport system permease small subunit
MMMKKSLQTGPPDGGLARKLITLMATVSGLGAFIAILCAMLVICYEVMARYVFSWPTVWEIEAAVFLLIFATFVGSVHGVKDDAHVSMDMVATMIKPRIRTKLNTATSFASMVLCIFVSIKGWEMWWEAYSLGWHSDSIWAPPLWIPYLFLPIGFTLMSLQYLVLLISRIASFRNSGSKP